MNAFAAIALGVGLVACVTDVRERRIPNVLTFGAAGAALLVHLAIGGPNGLGAAAAGWAVGTALFLPFFLLGGMGAGDVKLLAALGAWLGPSDAFWLAIYASLAGGVTALFVALWHGYLWQAVRNVSSMVLFWCLVGPRPVPSVTLEDSRAPRLAYAIPIFLGTVMTVWLR
ncbi:MAG TPA: A24 family peptidase [Vicinamibacterales bacterium]|nr:A24 family peptidase [Vicinamibacterales bacterium]